MKRVFTVGVAVLMVLTFGLFAMASGEEETTSEAGNGNQSAGQAQKPQENNNRLGDYEVEIKSARLTKDFEGKDVVVITYAFTNHGKDNASFSFALNDEVFQNGVGLNESLFLKDGDEYSADNQTKEIKTGASLEVDVAYELNDTTTDVEVEVSELISFDDAKITKTFKIAE